MLAAQGGRIINMASIAGKGFRGTSNAAYASSKGAVIAFTYQAADNLARYNINVNAVCPGPIDTDMSQGVRRQRAEAAGQSYEENTIEGLDSIPLGPHDSARRRREDGGLPHGPRRLQHHRPDHQRRRGRAHELGGHSRPNAVFGPATLPRPHT